MLRQPSLICFLVCCLLSPVCVAPAIADEPQNPLSKYLIGYTEMRTDLPGERHANVSTMRAYAIHADGTDRREMVPELIRDENTWNQFAGWSPDGRTAILGNGYNTPENAAWEEANQTFRMTEGWLYDMHLVDMATGQATNVSTPERMSNYNSALSYWPGNNNKLLSSALIDGKNHPVSMNLDGTNKVDLNGGSTGFTYGIHVSPDGTQIAYHKDYQIYIADADGSNAMHIDTENNFNFNPQWSPAGQSVMFLSGVHEDSSPYVVQSNGTGLRKVADRQGYIGTWPIMDVYDFHTGSSDWPAWSPDGEWIYYTAQFDTNVELMRATVDGATQQRLTNSTTPGTLNYLPSVSPDGQWVMYGSMGGSDGGGLRQLYVMPAAGGMAVQITDVGVGSGAMFGYWNPVQLPEPSSMALLITGGCGGILFWRSRCCHAWKKCQILASE